MPLASCPFLIKVWVTLQGMRELGLVYMIGIIGVLIFKWKIRKPKK